MRRPPAAPMGSSGRQNIQMQSYRVARLNPSSAEIRNIGIVLPTGVIQRIAEYRTDDKPDSEYYARHTVTKAAAELKNRAATAPNSSSLNKESSREPDH